MGASIYFLSFLSGLDSVAVFSLGHKLASVLLMVLVLPFQLSFQPYVFSQLNDPDIKKQMGRLLTYLMWSVVCGSFCILFAVRLFLPLIAPPEFAEAYKVTLFMIPAMAFLGIFYYGETLLKAVQKSHIIGLFVVVSAVFSVVTNFILIHYMSWYGALIASNATFLILGGSLFLIGLKQFPLPLEWRRLRSTGFLFVGVLLINFFLQGFNLYLYSAIQILVAVIILMTAFRSTFLNKEEKYFAKQTFSRFMTLLRQTCRKGSEKIFRSEFPG